MTFPPVHEAGRRRPKRRRSWIVAAAVAIPILAFGGATARLFVWPQLSPPPPLVDAIVELGGPGDRDAAALALAREHRASVVVVSTAKSAAESGDCFPPVDGVSVLCFHAEPNTTRGEAQAVRRLAAQHNWRSIILVTTPDQAWRARVRVTRCFDGDVYVATTPLPAVKWFTQIPYQWVATVKAFTVERAC